MKTWFSLLLASFVVLQIVHAQGGSFQESARLFDYDQKLPLDVKSTVIHEKNGIKVHDLTYTSPKSGRVTAYLVVPAGKGPFAGIVFGHRGPGNRTEFLPEAMLYAEAGAVSLMIDYPWVRPAKHP